MCFIDRIFLYTYQFYIQSQYFKLYSQTFYIMSLWIFGICFVLILSDHGHTCITVAILQVAKLIGTSGGHQLY